MAQLDREIEAFIQLHGEQMYPHDVFICGVAAGIISRINNDARGPLIDVELPAVRYE
jgi:hypothetical protein